MGFILLSQGDLVQLKKKHPCSCDVFKITRAGADIKMICTVCSRELMLPREKAEKMIKRLLPKEI